MATSKELVDKIVAFHTEIIRDAEARLVALKAQGKGLAYGECRDLTIIVADSKKAIKNAKWI